MTLAITDPRKRKHVEYLAGTVGVTPERFLEVMRARSVYRARKYHARRSRKRALEKNPKAFKRKPAIGNIYSGESDFEAMLRVVGMSNTDFIRRTGIREDLFYKWYGNPMHPWPVEFLRLYGYAKAMEKHLMENGVDCTRFQPKLPTTLLKHGRYPRKAGQGPKIAPDVNYSPWKP